jgi:hypothetical protein
MLNFVSNATTDGQPDQGQTGSTMQMRLREEPPTITTGGRGNRKRKSPSSDVTALQNVIPSGVPIMHQLSGSIPPGFQYNPADFSPGGLPQQPDQQQSSQSPQQSQAAGGRQLSTSKRAEQNRKAQRAFRERRDQ